MSNIYIIIKKLEKSLDMPAFTVEQKSFLSALLLGEKNKWRSLTELAEAPKQIEIAAIISALENESKTNGSKGFLNSDYDSLLAQCLNNFHAMNKHFDLAERMMEKDNFIRFANKYDELFQKTVEKYYGNIILPICQALDVRLANSKGECHGYVCEWATSILEKKKPFGIDVNQPSPFKPIKANSFLGRDKIEWNHLAVLNKNISQFQGALPDSLKKETRRNIRFYLSTATLARQLIIKLNEYPDKVLELIIYGGVGFTGHALGFCKIGDDYHFLDSNALWVSFKRPADFELWLSYYFSVMKYDKMFNEYHINSYQVSPSKQPHQQSKDTYTDKVLQGLAIAAVAPVVGSYFFGVRPMIHVGMGIGKTCQTMSEWFSKDIKKGALTSLFKESFIDNSYTGRLTRSLDDIAIVGSSSKMSFIDSRFSLASDLDVPGEKVNKARQHLIENNNSVQFFKAKKVVTVCEDEASVPHDMDLSACVISNYF